jgi:HSP20 family protein
MNSTAQQQTQSTQTERRRERGFVIPPANISAKDNGYMLEVEMPGVDKAGLEITVEANELRIVGRRKTDVPAGQMYYSEWPDADFQRVFELGPDVDTSRINAQMDQGVLRLTLPKSERAKRRKIEISG